MPPRPPVRTSHGRGRLDHGPADVGDRRLGEARDLAISRLRGGTVGTDSVNE
jgi:hypothetical protein